MSTARVFTVGCGASHEWRMGRNQGSLAALSLAITLIQTSSQAEVKNQWVAVEFLVNKKCKWQDMEFFLPC